MTNPHVSPQLVHVFISGEDIAHQPVVLAQMQAITICRDDARSILTAMLEHSEGVKQLLVHRGFGNDAGDTAHGGSSLSQEEGE
jgi:hypothetical protein